MGGAERQQLNTFPRQRRRFATAAAAVLAAGFLAGAGGCHVHLVTIELGRCADRPATDDGERQNAEEILEDVIHGSLEMDTQQGDQPPAQP
jgi:hypothetical protein